MNIDFPLILTLLVIISGVIALIDILFLAKRRQKSGLKMSRVVEYSRSFFPVLLLVWLIRSFIIQPYRVPTGSLEPTVKPGDFIAVTQYNYGLRLPVLRTKIFNIGEPKVGQIALFHWPVEPSIVFVKRVIGVPGDHIIYQDKVLTINGQVMQQKPDGAGFDTEPGEKPYPVVIKEEDLVGQWHKIQLRQTNGEPMNFDITVPKGMYFMMGDNRDDSEDSRFWGFVPEKDLIGKAQFIILSWDSNKHWFRVHRFFKDLYS